MLILQSWSRWISRYINKTTKKLPSNKLLITPSNCVLRSCFCLLTCESNASRSIMINVLSIAYVTNKITYALATSLGLESVNWHPLGQYYNTKVQVIALLDHTHFYDPSHLVARWASTQYHLTILESTTSSLQLINTLYALGIECLCDSVHSPSFNCPIKSLEQ